MTTRLSEDDIYRTSTQYRLWSFSPAQLAAQRRKTHELALARARQYASQDGASNGGMPECLTEEEEMRLVQGYCDTVRKACDHLRWPIHVKATAVQYLRRFYLSNSCMTYPPREIYQTAMFLASKSEAIHVTVPKFAASIRGNPEAILAPEYKLMQALRFTLDVRQPFRGLKGAMMELLNMAEGLMGSLDGTEQKSGKEVQDGMLSLKAPPEGCRSQWKAPSGTATPKNLKDRVMLAYEAAKDLCDGAASMTDAYFLYTPSQILHAALHLADEPLTSFFLDNKLPISSEVRPKIHSTIESCAAMLRFFGRDSIPAKEDRQTLDQKLDRCRDPTTKDLIKSHAAMKRNGAEEGKVDEEKSKRRKLEREKSSKEMDDLFGPSLQQHKANGNG